MTKPIALSSLSIIVVHGLKDLRESVNAYNAIHALLHVPHDWDDREAEVMSTVGRVDMAALLVTLNDAMMTKLEGVEKVALDLQRQIAPDLHA